MPTEVKPGVMVAKVTATLNVKDNKHVLKVREEYLLIISVMWHLSCCVFPDSLTLPMLRLFSSRGKRTQRFLKTI